MLCARGRLAVALAPFRSFALSVVLLLCALGRRRLIVGAAGTAGDALQRLAQGAFAVQRAGEDLEQHPAAATAAALLAQVRPPLPASLALGSRRRGLPRRALPQRA